MKLIAHLCVSLGLGLSMAGGQTVDRLTLSSTRAVPIRVSMKGTTTLLFSRPVGAILGQHLTNGESEVVEGASYQYAHQPGTTLLAVTALVPDQEVSMVLVIDEKLYILRLTHDDERPHVAVQLTVPKPAAPTRPTVKAKPVSTSAARPRQPVMPTLPNLNRLLELAKGQRPGQTRFPLQRVHYPLPQGTLTATVDRIIHLKTDNAVVLSGVVINRRRLFRAPLAPANCQLLAGGRRHALALIQMADEVPRGGSVRFWAVVAPARTSGIRFDQPVHLLLHPNP